MAGAGRRLAFEPASHYESPPRLALATMRPETRALWRTRYLNDDGQELPAMAVLEKAEAKLRIASALVVESR